MRKQLLLLLIFLVSASVSYSQLIAVESFDYDLDMEVNYAEGGNGWAGPWEMFEGPDYSSSVTIVEEGTLPEGIEFDTKGNRFRGECVQANQAMRLYRPLTNPIIDDGSEVWISFLLESENAISGSWQGVSLWSPDGEGEQSLFGKNWGFMEYGAVVKGTGVNTAETVQNNVPVWVVVKIEFSGDASAENCFMWINPDPTTVPDVTAAGATNSGLLNNGATHIACHFGNTVGIVVYFDELRIASTFEDVVPKKEVGVAKIKTEKIKSSCYPNPFNTSTTINYSVESTESVSLDVYNIVGEKVETLINKVQSPGNYKTQLNRRGLQNGIYYYKLKIGNTIDTKKIVIN